MATIGKNVKVQIIGESGEWVDIGPVDGPIEIGVSSGWIDATPFGAPYQHLINRDGRARWRTLADPADARPPEWRLGHPPAELVPDIKGSDDWSQSRRDKENP